MRLRKMEDEEMNSPNEDIGILEARELTYQILRSAFNNPPSEDLLKATVQEKLFDSFPLEVNTEGFRQGLNQLRLWFSQVSEKLLENVVTELKDDYLRLFLGPNQLLAPPWESVYLTEERLTFDQITLDVRAFYRRHGLEFCLLNKEPDDHFGIELEFMAGLVSRQVYNLENGQYEEAHFLAQEQLAFLRDHLSRWTPPFTLSVIENAHTDYYQGIARLARDFIAWDYELLGRLENGN
ncbi:MAG: TorD/DmsD family molecular chaperone [Desulfitobacterium sp.]